MKKFITFALAIVCANVLYAQNTLVATLTHGDNITMYYGNDAFKKAHNAAVSGDIINLSGGTFNGTTITKAVTIRGTGIDVANPTIINCGNNNTVQLNISAEDTCRFFMEGIRCTGAFIVFDTNEYPTFQKCQLNDVLFSGQSNAQKGKQRNVTYIDCKITGKHSYGTYSASHTVQFINSYINYIEISPINCTFLNCIIQYQPHNKIVNSLLVNCILYNSSSGTQKLNNTTIATNCVAINQPNLFDNSQSNTDCTTSTFEEMFKDFAGTYTDAQTFELTDEAKAQFLGTDGTEIGMHGGVFPYTSTPSYPQITKMNVANKTTADGKLSVDIEVSAAQ